MRKGRRPPPIKPTLPPPAPRKQAIVPLSANDKIGLQRLYKILVEEGAEIIITDFPGQGSEKWLYLQSLAREDGHWCPFRAFEEISPGDSGIGSGAYIYVPVDDRRDSETREDARKRRSDEYWRERENGTKKRIMLAF